MGDTSLLILIIIILMAWVFDFINGFHDAANSIATMVSTRVMSPRWAVLWASFFNFIAFLFFHAKVASTIGIGLIDPNIINSHVLFSALCAAIIWGLITWYFGLPSSSSHALIGGLVGGAIAKAGFHHLIFFGILKVLVSIVLSPLLGLVLAFFLMAGVIKLFANGQKSKSELLFKRLQIFSAGLYSLGHGGNDAQKTMGIISALLFSANRLGSHFYVPLWVVISCNFVMAAGTFFGGWRIVKTLGMKITRLKPVHGFCAETTAAVTLFLATMLGIPVSTTHTIAGSIVGVGLVIKPKAVRWTVANSIIWAWILTIPLSAVLAWFFFEVVNLFL